MLTLAYSMRSQRVDLTRAHNVEDVMNTQMKRQSCNPCRLPVPVPVPVPVPTRRTGRVVRMLARGLAFALPIFMLGNVGTANARSQYTDYIADGSVVEVKVKVNGRTAPLFSKPHDWNKHYFQAFEGRNYSLVLRNTTNQRIGVLIAVDGINVVNGERSRLKRHEPMYVLEPWGRAEIKGWRTSMKSVRRFVFVDEQRSYASRTGQANRDMGWVRVLAFREKPRIAWKPPDIRFDNDDRARGSGEVRREGERREATPNTAGRKQSADSFHGGDSFPGTGWGDRKHDPVRRTHFEPQRHAADQLVFRYEYASGLRALGFLPKRWKRDRMWERENGYLGFAKPPRW